MKKFPRINNEDGINTLCRMTTELEYDDIPAEVIELAKDYRIYTLPHSDAKKLHIIITVYDQQGNTITKKDLKDVEIKQNNQTICSLNLFDGEEDGSTADFYFDPTWEGYIEAEF